MRDASICGLGQSSPNPVLAGLKFFRNEYLTHILEGKCPTGTCMIKREVDVIA